MGGEGGGAQAFAGHAHHSWEPTAEVILRHLVTIQILILALTYDDLFSLVFT